MYYHQSSHDRDRVYIEFTGLEVRAVSEAHKELIAYLVSSGNGNFISDYQRRIAKWTGDVQSYNAASNKPLIEVLEYFCGTTEERVDEILYIAGNSSRYVSAGERYELGQKGSHLLLGIECQSSIDSERGELLDE